VRKTLSSLENQIEDLRTLRRHDEHAIQTLRNKEAELNKEKDRLLVMINELKADKQFLRQLCAELSSALKIRS
jgi:hypothetical protein